MLPWQYVTMLTTLCLFSGLLLVFLKSFKPKKGLYLSLFVVLAIFTIGFGMRLSGGQAMIDTGYYLTDISALFVSITFTAALVLGQQKYWRI